MDRKTKKILLISSIVGIVIIVVSLFYMVNSSKELELRSGTYFCKMYILNQGTTKTFKWDLSISKNDSKNSVIENEFNSKSLQKFRNTISEIIKKRYEMFALILYLIFVLIIFISVRKDSKLYEKESNKRFLQVFFTLLIIFLIYKGILCFAQLNGLYKDVNYYFSLIL